MLTPLEDKVLLEKVNEAEQKVGSIILTAVKKPLVKGIVLAVGEGHLSQTGVRVPLTVEPGDTVLYQDGHGIDYDGQILVSATSIVAKIGE